MTQRTTVGTVQAMEIKLPLTSAVAGVSFHADALVGITPGMAVTVRHDTDNPYDRNACAVYVRDQLIGYLPKSLARRMVERGEAAWRGVVSEVLAGGQATGVRVRILTGSPADRPRPLEVRARSGRLLGTFAGRRDGRVAILTDGGSRVEYPAELLEPLPEGV